MRLIDADDLKDSVQIWLETIDNKPLHKLIDEQPTIEAVPVVHGEWIKTDKGIAINANTWKGERQFSYKCAMCGYTTGNQGKNFKFCPNCGAKMDGEL